MERRRDGGVCVSVKWVSRLPTNEDSANHTQQQIDTMIHKWEKTVREQCYQELRRTLNIAIELLDHCLVAAFRTCVCRDHCKSKT